MLKLVKDGEGGSRIGGNGLRPRCRPDNISISPHQQGVLEPRSHPSKKSCCGLKPADLGTCGAQSLAGAAWQDKASDSVDSRCLRLSANRTPCCQSASSFLRRDHAKHTQPPLQAQSSTNLNPYSTSAPCW